MKKYLITLALVGGLIPTLSGHPEAPSCAVCLEEYENNRLAIQLDCNQAVAHHICLDDANRLVDHGQNCPICRAPIRVIDPRIQGSYTTLHHLYRPTTQVEQAGLRRFLQRVPLSQKITDAVDKSCQGCSVEHDDRTLIRFTCSHAFCLQEALKLAQGRRSCPTCNKQLRLVDPIKKEGTLIEYVYLNRIVPSHEKASIERVRSSFPLYQEHIPAHQRVSVRQAQQQRPSRPQRPSVQRPQDLPVLPGIFAERPLTQEEVYLTSTYLPAHLSPTVWQVLVQIDGSYARIRRERELPHWPPTIKGSSSNIAQTLGRQLFTGILCGVLLGPDLHEGAMSTHSLLYIPSIIYSLHGIYSSYRKSTEQGLSDAAKWLVGLALGANINSSKKQAEN